MHFPESNMLQLAQEGDPISCLKLGHYYFYSAHIENNCQQAFEWIHRAAEQGNPKAQFWVADLYSLGQGTQQSNTNAYHYYTMAALQGCEDARFRLRRLYHDEVMLQCPGVLNKTEEDIIPLGIRGVQSTIAKLYNLRTKYIRPNLIKDSLIAYFCERFKRWKYADMLDPDGSTENMMQLAFLYHHGYGVVKDVEQAIGLYTKAANRGCMDAQYNLAYLYQCERMEEEFKYEKALYWYASAAHGGHIAAQNHLDYLSQHGLKLNHLLSFDQTQWADRKASELPDPLLFSITATYKRFISTTGLISLSEKAGLRAKLNHDISTINQPVYVDEISELAKRAISGDKFAIYQVGMHYYHARDGFPCDQYIGCQWIKLAAKLDVDDAQLFMGEIYQKDNALEQNYFKASIWLRRAKQNKAKFQLGLLYEKGLGVFRSYTMAESLLKKAVDNSVAFQLGLFYYYNNHYSAAINVFETCAKRGEIEAIDRIRSMYWKGHGVDKNPQKAFQLLEYAADRGHTRSQLALASLYHRGSFIPRDLPKANAYYFLAAEGGNPYAKYYMAMTYLARERDERNYAKAFQLIQSSASEGCAFADKILTVPSNINHYRMGSSAILNMFLYVMEHNLGHVEYNLGCIYEERVYWQLGTIAARLNTASAIHWYTIAINQNNADAQYRLGLLFEEGKAVEMDLPRAFNYYRMAVNSRHCEATIRLAFMYLEGRGTEQDFKAAYHLFYDASIMGHSGATDIISLTIYKRNIKYTTCPLRLKINEADNIKMLEMVGSENHAVQYELGLLFSYREPKRSIPWYEKAGKGGITAAYYNLGVMYEKGVEGISQDYLKAVQMYHLCVSQDYPEAIYRLGRMYQYGRGIQQDYNQAYHLYEKAVSLSNDYRFRVLNRTKQNNIEPKSRFNYCLVHKFHDSIAMWKHIAQQGNSQAQYELGYAYHWGFGEPNFPECIKWYSMASDHPDAIHTLGYFHEKGLGGFAQNTQEAIRLYKKAKKLGNVESIYRMGEIYYNGTGIDADAMKGILYYIEASRDGCLDSRNRLCQLYSSGHIALQNSIDSKLLKGCEDIYHQSTYDAYRDYVF